MAKTALEQLENLRQSPCEWAAMNKQEVEEIMKATNGFVVNYGTKYWISFRFAWKRLSAFVLERSGCKDGDYYVCLVDSRLYTPYREWD